jgi:hypothetical protein
MPPPSHATWRTGELSPVLADGLVDDLGLT